MFGSVITCTHDSEDWHLVFSGHIYFLFIDVAQVYLYSFLVTEAHLLIYDDRGGTIVHMLYRMAHKPLIKVFHLS